SLGKLAENQENDYHSISAKKAYRNMFLRKREITEELDAGLEKNSNSYYTAKDGPELHSKFNELDKLKDVLKKSAISPESYHTEEENNRLENTNYLINRIIYNIDKVNWTKGTQCYDRHRYDLKNKKDYFEGNKAYLNNTFTGGVIKLAIEQQKYKSASPYTVVIIIAVPITALFELPTKSILNGIGALAYGIGALAYGIGANNKPAQTKQTKFLSEEDVNNFNNHNPESPTSKMGHPDHVTPAMQPMQAVSTDTLQTNHHRTEDNQEYQASVKAGIGRSLEVKEAITKADPEAEEDKVTTLGRNNNQT
ncbi:MAG: hypothetical protein VXZ73_04790, partial [Pseudomonadota bacterium]|nr:hypothetical protein [Pseudomonadota bacterium]